MPQRRGAAGADEAARVPGVRHASARRATRSGRRWCPPRARARRTTSTAGWTAASPREAARCLSAPTPSRSTSRAGPARLPLRDAPTIVHGPRRRRRDVRRAHRARSSCRRSATRPLAELRRRRASCSTRRGAAGVLHRLLRGPAAVLPRRHIGDLAVNGTVNDLAMCGADAAVPLGGVHPGGGHRAGRRRRGSPTRWARRRARAGVQLVTGDTKVVDARQRRRRLRQHRRASAWSPAGVDIRPDARRARRRRDRQRRRSACTASRS